MAAALNPNLRQPALVAVHLFTCSASTRKVPAVNTTTRTIARESKTGELDAPTMELRKFANSPGRSDKAENRALSPAAKPSAPFSMDNIAELTSKSATVSSLTLPVPLLCFHFANLWFAGQAGNWPLANYYFSEGRNHIRWLIRIVPNPKGPDGNPVDVKGIFDGLDTTTFADLKKVIDEKDAQKFPEAYRTTLESCYQCHKAVGRPYLRLMVPKTVPQPIINLDPAATWPK